MADIYPSDLIPWCQPAGCASSFVDESMSLNVCHALLSLSKLLFSRPSGPLTSSPEFYSALSTGMVGRTT